jgi:UDP-galactopyranose mutase
MTDAGKKCLVIDKRTHIGGNVYTENIKGIDVHKYGPHIFHTNSKKIWDYVNQFAEFNDYRHKVLSCHNAFLYSFPLNLKTLEQLWPGLDDENLLAKFEKKQSENQIWDNLEDWAIAEVGEEIYRKFIYGYTKKQWGMEPKYLPRSIISRIPVRTDRNDDYHNAKFSGIPIRGYTDMVSNMLDGIDVMLGLDYLDEREHWDKQATTIVYTGPIDEFFNYKHGELQWRSLSFEEKIYDYTTSEYGATLQPVAQINYPDDDVAYTRTVEHKHFNNTNQKHSIVTYEYPQEYKRGREKFYPINDLSNNTLYQKYKAMIPDGHIFGGRLAEYKYYDMDQVIAAAITKSKKEK